MKRRPVTPQVRHFSSVPRAVFEALYCAAPGGLTFQALSLAGLRSLSTAAGTYRRNRGWVPQKRRLPWSPATRGWRAGTAQLRLSRRGCACCTLSRPPPPIRTCERLRRRPSWIEARALSGRSGGACITFFLECWRRGAGAPSPLPIAGEGKRNERCAQKRPSSCRPCPRHDRIGDAVGRAKRSVPATRRGHACHR